MLKVTTLLTRAAEVTREDVREYYETSYVPTLRAALPELTRYVRNYVVGASFLPWGWDPDFDLVTQMWLSGPEALAAMSAFERTPTGRRLADDAAAYLEASAVRTFTVEECDSGIAPSPTPVGAKALLFVARRDLLTVEQFRLHYETGHAVLVSKMMAPNLLKYVRNYVGESLTPGWSPNFDTLTEFWVAQMFGREGEPGFQYLIRDEEQFMDRSSFRVVRVEEIGDTERITA